MNTIAQDSTTTTNSEIFFESINPKWISELDFNKICEIEQDMRARDEGLWEYVKCTCCNSIFSKQDIFWHLSSNIYSMTVAKIENLLDLDWVKCQNCNQKTQLIYWDSEHRKKVQERYKDSESHITVFRDENWEIKWFMDAYVDTLATIFHRELKYHYWNVWLEKIKKVIEDTMWREIPNSLLSFSALWTVEW